MHYNQPSPEFLKEYRDNNDNSVIRREGALLRAPDRRLMPEELKYEVTTPSKVSFEPNKIKNFLSQLLQGFRITQVDSVFSTIISLIIFLLFRISSVYLAEYIKY